MDETNGHGDGDVVQALWRYPIKSMMGEAVSTTEISTRGLLGDRAYALVDKASNRAAAVRTWAAGLMTTAPGSWRSPAQPRRALPSRSPCPTAPLWSRRNQTSMSGFPNVSGGG